MGRSRAGSLRNGSVLAAAVATLLSVVPGSGFTQAASAQEAPGPTVIFSDDFEGAVGTLLSDIPNWMIEPDGATVDILSDSFATDCEAVGMQARCLDIAGSSQVPTVAIVTEQSFTVGPGAWYAVVLDLGGSGRMASPTDGMTVEVTDGSSTFALARFERAYDAQVERVAVPFRVETSTSVRLVLTSTTAVDDQGLLVDNVELVQLDLTPTGLSLRQDAAAGAPGSSVTLDAVVTAQSVGIGQNAFAPPVSGVDVTFSVDGTEAPDPTTVTTDADGVASIQLTGPASVGDWVITATAGFLLDSVTHSWTGSAPAVDLVAFGPAWTGDSWGLTESYLTTTVSYLLDPANFGPEGIVPRQFSITSVDTVTADALIAALADADVFFTGWVDTASYNLTSTESVPRSVKQILRDFVDAGGSLIGTTDDTGHTFVDAFGLVQQDGQGSPTLNTVTTTNHPIASAPFGSVSSYEQWFLTGSYADTSLNGADEIGRQGTGEFLGSPSIVVFGPDSLNEGSGPAVFVADVDVFSNQGGAAFNATLIKNIFAWVATAAPVGPTILEGASLSASPAEVFAGLDSISINDIPISLLTEDTSTESAPLSAIPLSAIGIADSPLSAIPLSAIPLNAIPLSAIKLSDIPLSAIGGWEHLLAGTSLEGAILQSVTLQDVQDQAPHVLDEIGFGDAELASTAIGDASLFEILFPDPGTTLSSPLSAIGLSTSPLSAIPLSAIRIEGLPLSAIPLSAIPLSAIDVEGAPLSAIPLSAIDILGSPLSAIPLSAIAVGDEELCGVDPCTAVGVDRTADDLLTLANSMIAEYGSLSASPLSAIPLSAIDLSTVPLSAIPLSAIAPEVSPLSAIPLSAIPLGAIGLDSLYDLPLSETYVCEILPGGCGTATNLGDLLDAYSTTPIESSPLSAIPLSAIPLWAIPLSAIPLSAIPLSAILLGDTPLSAIDLRNSPLSAIPLSAIPLSAVAPDVSPLSAIPLSAIPLSAIDTVVDCSAIDCTNLALTLGEIADASAIRSDATLGDIVEALSAYTLADLHEYGSVSLQDLIDSLSLAYVYGDRTVGDGAAFGDLTLADLLVLLIPIDDLPWQDVDPNGLQLVVCGNNEIASCDSEGVDVVGYVVAYSITGGAGADPVDVMVTLPDGFVALPGLVDLTTAVADGETASSSVALVEPTSIDGSTVSFTGLPGGAADYTLAVKAAPGFELGSKTASAVVALGEQSISASAAVNVVDREPPVGEESPPVVEDDVVYYRHLAPSSDVDLFDIPIPAVSGSRVTVEIGQLENSDADLVVFKPADLPPTAFDEASPLNTVPVADEAGTQSETIQDVPTGQGQVAGASTQRDTGNEQTTVINDGSDAGYYTIQVELYNDGITGATVATSPLYSVRVDEDAPPSVPICAPLDLSGGTPGSAPPTIPAGIETLILVNQQRMQAAYGPAADTVMTRLGAFAARSGVNGVVYPVDSDGDVRNAYSAWDANPCDPNLANGVVSAITQIVEEARDASSNLRYVVVVGSDDIIPMWREADLVSLSNERDYAPTFDRGTDGGRIGSLYGAFVTGNILTDAAYADFNPIPFLSGHLFVEDLAIGRLVETADEIINQIDVFEASNATLDPATADYAVTGYDFLADGSQAVADALAANLGGTGTVDIDDYETTSGFWTAQDVIDILNQDPDFASINAHYDHNRSLPSDQDAANTENDLFTVADVAGLSASLAGSILFTMGCHGGLNVSAIGVGSSDPRVPDWAQQFAREGALYTANTGFGYGDTALVAYSERLMELFAEQLDGSRPAGEAFAIAKNLYYLELGMAAVYDAKVMMEATFYGLPMYRFDATDGSGTTPSDPRVGGIVEEPVTGQRARTVSLSDPVGTGGFVSNASEAGGSFYTLDGAVTVHDRPIQPLSVIDVPPAADGSLPRGALVESLENTDLAGFTVAIARPVIDLTANEQPKIPIESFFPTRLQNVACSTVLGENLCRLTMVRGQFRSESDNTGTQRLFTDVEATVYYADANETDVRPPTFNRVQVSEVGSTGFGVSADVSDDSLNTVTRTMCLYRLPGGTVWDALELVRGTSGLWTGGASAGGAAIDQIEVFCQAVDHAGNVGVTTFKGLNYRPAPPPPTGGLTITASGIPGDNGWYTSAVDVNVSGSSIFTASIDGGTPVEVPVTVSDDGVHVVTIQGADGSTGSIVVPIDATPPVVNPKADGAVYDLGEVVTDPACADAGSGIASCELAIDTSSAGTKTASGSATDLAGNAAQSLSLTYSVIEGPSITVSPTLIAAGGSTTSVVFGFTDLTEATERVTWFWGDGSQSTSEDDTSTSRSDIHEYTTPGVYTVGATVDHIVGGDVIASRIVSFDQYVVVYDPQGGFVTGGGWIDSPVGAYAADPDLSGKANFGFVSKYKRGSSVPTGNTEFQFNAGDLNFKSTSYEWLVIAGARAQFKGVGTINGTGNHGFLLTAIDGALPGGGDSDKFRIKIWDKNNDDTIVYDNKKIGSADDSTEATALGGGSIVIKTK